MENSGKMSTLNENYFRLIAENISDMLWTMDLNLCVDYINPAVEKIRGYAVEEVMNQKIEDIIAPSSMGIALKTLEEAMVAEGKEDRDLSRIWTLEIELIHKNGSKVWTESKITFLRDQEGNAAGILGVSRDISERRQKEEEIKNLKQQLEFILGATKTGLDIIDSSFNLRYVDPEWAKVYGEYAGRKCHEYFAGRDKVCPSCGIPKAFELKRPVVREETLPKEGNRQIQVTTIPFQNDKGEWLVAEVNVDVTERNIMEQQLIENEQRFRTLVANIPGIVYRCVADSEWTMEYISKEVELIAGYPAADFIKNNVRAYGSIIHPEDRPYVYDFIREAISHKEPYTLEYRIVHNNGDIRWVMEKGQGVFNNEGKLLWFDGAIFDITERKKEKDELEMAYIKLKETQQQLIQTAKMAAMGQLAAGISHELNQPLTGIRGFAQAALLDLTAEHPLRTDLQKIIEQTDRMDGIIKNVRFFARKSEFRLQELDLNQPIEDALMLLNEQLKVHNIQVIKSLTSDLPLILGDSNQLQQVFLNLITNSRDAIDHLNRPEGGRLIIKTALSKDKNNIEIIFQDTGCGIPKKNLEHIFNPFFTTKSPDGGIGLGLSIVYRIIEAHKGNIEIESKEGQGTRLKINLPIFKPG